MLIFIEVLAGKLKSKTKAKKFVKDIRRLIGTYFGKKSDGFVKWIKAVEKLQRASRTGNSLAAVLTMLGKKTGPILKQLESVARILDEIRGLQRTKNGRVECDRLRRKMKRLIADVEELKPKKATGRRVSLPVRRIAMNL